MWAYFLEIASKIHQHTHVNFSQKRARSPLTPSSINKKKTWPSDVKLCGDWLDEEKKKKQTNHVLFLKSEFIAYLGEWLKSMLSNSLNHLELAAWVKQKLDIWTWITAWKKFMCVEAIPARLDILFMQMPLQQRNDSMQIMFKNLLCKTEKVIFHPTIEAGADFFGSIYLFSRALHHQLVLIAYPFNWKMFHHRLYLFINYSLPCPRNLASNKFIPRTQSKHANLQPCFDRHTSRVARANVTTLQGRCLPYYHLPT